MSTACFKLFDIPELADLVTARLARGDLSRLNRTCRKLHSCCTPVFYENLELYNYGSENRILDSAPGMMALGRNIQLVKKLDIGIKELAILYNFFALCDPDNSCPHGAAESLVSRPTWLPALYPPNPRVVPLPPMTGLEKLIFRDDNEFSLNDPPSVEQLKANLALLCWILSNSPRLAYLKSDGVYILDQHDYRLFVHTLAGLCELKSLDLFVTCRKRIHSALGRSLFFACPPSTSFLELNFVDVPPYYTRQDQQTCDEKRDIIDSDDTTVGKRQGPLPNLENLDLWRMRSPASATDILSIFEHCPGIKHLNLPEVSTFPEADRIGTFIGQHCSQLRSFSCQLEKASPSDSLPYKIMDALPAQQLEEVGLCGRWSSLVVPSIILALQRHSATLRRIDFTSSFHMCRMSAAAILKDCVNLERLILTCPPLPGLYIDLADALEHPWGCTKLQHLMLDIRGCELPLTPGVQPYFCRPAPIVLSEDEVLQFDRLERLYLQIGRLTALRELTLQMVTVELEGSASQSAFPAMLCLPDIETNRPGYLHHLAGLTNLDTFLGSTRAEVFENNRTVGWNEVRWMEAHWPRLKKASFLFEVDSGDPMLTLNLDPEDVSHLARTNRKLHQLCMPSVFKVLVVARRREGPWYQVSRIFSYAPSMNAFARNVQHVRKLYFGRNELDYHHHCVLAFEEGAITLAAGHQFITERQPIRLLPLHDTVLATWSLHLPVAALFGFQQSWECVQPKNLGATVLAAVYEPCWDEDEAIERTQELLYNLEELLFRDMLCTGSKSEASVRAIFAHCPYIRKLATSTISGYQDINAIGQFVEEACRKIEFLDYISLKHSEEDFSPFRIMESLPAQQVANFAYNGCLPGDDGSEINLSIQRHSTTLQRIYIGGAINDDRISIAVIFKECTALHELIIDFPAPNGFFISLDDAVRHPWACTKLLRLQLAISGCELPLEPSDPPYYSRSAPITLTEGETELFARLESLYSRIGTLTELQELHLGMVPLEGDVEKEEIVYISLFPAMMSLGDAETGRTGYLRHLIGLDKLEVLRRGIYANPLETTWPETRWMEQHWPRLQRAEFFPGGMVITEPFLWLEDMGKNGPVPIRYY
ncbi:hypothetical protein BGZ95_000069 [Linnemannia exigua]|uniref:Uncharacterized protein n=1 Tax=Linnemannia exigua TaxID=604196 RepID=A0AAD4D8S7_9FUNG|nr:hypothetical protein BGZ95_000069 [Linnemannia exigua]